MVFTKHDVRKEGTYGWYPSQINIYQNPRETQGYEKECLFKHWKSAYHHTNPTGVSMPTSPPGMDSRRVKSAAPNAVRKLGTTRTASARTAKANFNASMMVTGSRPPSHFDFRMGTPQPRESPIPTPKHTSQGHHGWRPQPTIIGVTNPEQPFISTLTSAQEGHASVYPVEFNTATYSDKQGTDTELQQIAPSPCINTVKQARAQSASIQRQRIKSTRSIRSADVRSRINRPSNTTAWESEQPGTLSDSVVMPLVDTYVEQCKHETTTPEPPLRPSAPVNMRSDTPPYEEQKDRYGWLVEIPGDPLNIKRIPKRLPYTVKCKEPTVKATPYKVKVMDGNTFFSNTIPRKPMTFTVHPEWQSEVFVAKRKELEKQGKKFHTRSFGFVY